MERCVGKDNKIKVLFFLGHLGRGGAERVASNLMQHLNRDRFNITLVLCEDEVSYSIPYDIKKYVLYNKKIFLFNHLTKILNFYSILIKEKPDVILSFMEYPNIINVLFKYIFPFQNIKRVISVHTYLSMFLKDNFLVKTLCKVFYKKADKVIAVSKGCANDLNKRFGVPADKVIAIYNPLDFKNIDKLKNEEIQDHWFKNDNPKIIAVGSLQKVKGHDYLLRAFKIVRENEINANLIILGEGKERDNIKNLAKDLKIEDHVMLPGFKENPYKYLKNSSVFVLSSIYEGFPNVLIEAMVCSVPVIATRCPSGPEEIITDGVNGLLVPIKDEKALAEAMIDLLKDKNKSERLAKEGRKRVEDFDVKKIVKEYEKVFL